MLNFLCQLIAQKLSVSIPPTLAQGHAFLGGKKKITNEWQDDKKKTLKFLLGQVCLRTLHYGVSDLGRSLSRGMLPEAMALPYFLAKRLKAPSSENRCCNVTESKMRKTAGWTSLHTTQTLGEHAQCYISLSTVFVQDTHKASQGKQVGSYRLVPALQSYNVLLTWASSSKKLSGSPGEFPCMLKFMRCINRGSHQHIQICDCPDYSTGIYKLK